ncbi:hypothetical protein [Methylobacterium sp. J-076]|uniref:hypothetical protein n=1 Tax=Methylobacterium sp. J-076 TaxID=2836655 RepID=UPI001FB8F60C|nr:hypothetical protein [Methylobacterium sp. J-076]MCJ2011544.1 hypothetical protein [Methylobacterium sp. J-076]
MPLWKEIAGTEPETVVERPANALRQAKGKFEKGQLLIQQHPSRVDFIYSPNDFNPMQANDSPFVEIGTAGEAFSVFNSKIRLINSLNFNCARIAYGPTLFMKRGSVVECNEIFNTFNPNIQIDAKKDSDLFLQLNKPIKSINNNAIVINRIFKWQVTEFGLITLAPDAKTLIEQTSASMCRLELDYSTIQNGSVALDVEARAALFEEMQHDAHEVFARSGS